MDEHLIARAYPAGQQGQMHGGCAGRERDDLFASAGELFQVFLESIDIRPQGNHPVRVESLLDKLLLLARHMRQAEIDTVPFTRHWHSFFYRFLSIHMLYFTRISICNNAIGQIFYHDTPGPDHVP